MAAQPDDSGVEACLSIKAKFAEFLDTFRESDGTDMAVNGEQGPDPAGQGESYYVEQVRAMQNQDKSTLYINFEHLSEWDADLGDVIITDNYRLDPYLRKAVQNLVRKLYPTFVENIDGGEKEFYLAYYNLPGLLRLRDLKAGRIGQLSAFSGTVTRTSEVRPELFLGAFRCLECQTVVRNVEQQFKYTTPIICGNPTCGNRKMWQLVREDSTFVDWQRVKVQESADEVPPGSLPRMMEVILRNDIVETARAGDKMVFNGNLIVVPDIASLAAPGQKTQMRQAPGGGGGEGVAGMKELGVKELTYKLAFLACCAQTAEAQSGMTNIRSEEPATPEEVAAAFSEEERAELATMQRNPRIYADMARSIAPGVFGHQDIKCAILLMLLGGVHKTTREGINLRGDINVAIVGDPACAKSQLLKYVARFLPRAVYTSGKSSSAAGLTATVVKETDSNEFCIEAGALMLADNGICCIDEFDKMDVKDQVAIHEAMEQQTISIAKAGIQATLNARTSILAAANPVGGRYDRAKPLKYNVALPPAILSRFDLLHVMIDTPDDSADFHVASHIVAVHQRRDAAFDVPYSMAQMQRYIKYARAIKPELTDEAQQALVEAYKRLRTEDAVPGSNTAYRITVRQLEALVRLSEAIARLHCQPAITPAFVQEARRLVKNSIIQVDEPEMEVDDEELVVNMLAVNDILHRDGDDAAGGDGGDAEGAEDMDADGDERGTDGAAAGPEAAAAGPSQAAGADQDEAGGSGQDQAAAPEPRKAPTKVTKKKFDQIKNLLVMRLREAEESGAGTVRDVAGNDVVGLSQKDLLTWLFDYQTSRGLAASSHREAQEEVVVVEKIVQHLIRRDNILIILEAPQRREDEEGEAYLGRAQSERIIGINPNYSD